MKNKFGALLFKYLVIFAVVWLCLYQVSQTGKFGQIKEIVISLLNYGTEVQIGNVKIDIPSKWVIADKKTNNLAIYHSEEPTEIITLFISPSNTIEQSEITLDRTNSHNCRNLYLIKSSDQTLEVLLNKNNGLTSFIGSYSGSYLMDICKMFD